MNSSLSISLRVCLPAMVIVGIFGTALGYALHRYDFRGKWILEQFLMLPMVIPPIVLGFYLVYFLGSRGVPGLFGLPGLIFTIPGGIVAISVVCMPLMMKSAKATFDMMPREYKEISYTLGKGRLETFFRVTLPICGPGIFAGLVMTLARALGEFGASLMILGNIPGRTATMPIAIWNLFCNGHEDEAFRLVLLLTGVSVILLVTAEAVQRRASAYLKR